MPLSQPPLPTLPPLYSQFLDLPLSSLGNHIICFDIVYLRNEAKMDVRNERIAVVATATARVFIAWKN